MTRPLFTGWVRPRGGPWERVARHEDYRRCWDRTLAAPLPGGGDRIVRLGEKHPDARRKPR